MGDGGAGQLDGGNGAAGGRQVAQVEGHGLWGGGQSWVVAGLGPRHELLPCGGIDSAGGPGLGVPEATAWAASRSRSGSCRESQSSGMVAKSLVTGT